MSFCLTNWTDIHLPRVKGSKGGRRRKGRRRSGGGGGLDLGVFVVWGNIIISSVCRGSVGCVTGRGIPRILVRRAGLLYGSLWALRGFGILVTNVARRTRRGIGRTKGILAISRKGGRRKF